MSNEKIEEPIDAEEIYEESSGNPEILDSEVSVNPEAPVTGARYDGNTHNIPNYIMIMDIYVKNIDKDGNNTWRKIYIIIY